MANTRNFNRSFSGGEISPEMFGRIDSDKYQTGAAKMLNMLAKPNGVAKNRPGFEYVASTKNPAVKSRLIKFLYSVGDALVVELGNNYIRFFKDGLPVLAGSFLGLLRETTIAFSSGSSTITWANNGLAIGDAVTFSTTQAGFTAGTKYYVVGTGVSTVQLSSSVGGIAKVASANASGITGGKVYFLSDCVTVSGYNFYAKQQIFSATTLPLTSPPSSSASWHYMPDNIYEVPSDYSSGDLFDITYAQSNDVLTLAHKSHPTRELRRYSNTSWQLVGVDWDSDIATPSGLQSYPKYGDSYPVSYIMPTLNAPAGSYSTIRIRFASGQPQITRGSSFNIYNSYCQAIDENEWIATSDTAYDGIYNYIHANQANKTLQLTVGFSANHYTLGQFENNSWFSNGARILVKTTPGLTGLGIAAYWVVGVTGDRFSLSTTKGGAPITTVTGTGSITYEIFPVVASQASPPVAQQYFCALQQKYESGSTKNSYVVTALNDSGSESPKSDPVEIKNNIYAAGSSNLITWENVASAKSYNIYKIQSGVFGYIGSTSEDSKEYTDVSFTLGAVAKLVSPTKSLKSGDAIAFYRTPSTVYFPVEITEGKVYIVKTPALLDEYGVHYFYDPVSTADVWISSVNTGAIKMAVRPSFTDDNIAPDMGITPPIYEAEDLSSPDNYPSSVCYFEQRRCVAGTTNDPQTLWMTKSGTESDMSYTIPSLDNNRIKVQSSSRERSSIRHLVSMQDLVALTDSAEWRVTSSDSGPITPSTISIRPQSFVGASNVHPQLVNNNLVFCSSRGGHVRELGYNWQAQSYVTGDLSLRAAHLFDSYEITDMCFSKSPLQVLWFVSSSGKLLGMTYVPEEQLNSWHQHETSGSFVSCCSIPEGEEDRVYVVVKRNIDGQDVHYIERMSRIEVDQDIANSFYVDSGVTKSDPATFTLIDGLDHLEGETVKVLADGVVLTKVVNGGSVTLDSPASVAHAGLAYVCDLQTLPITLQVDGFGQGRNYNVNKAWIRVFQTAGVKVGPSTDKLVAANPYVTTPQLEDATIQVMTSPSWQADGQVYIRQTEPLPMTVVGLTFEVSVGG